MEQAQKATEAPKPSSPSSPSPPWLDLLEPLTELILERLPLRDYLRFATICRKWRSIQKAHRLRHSPSPPPMAPSLPFLIATDLYTRPSLPHCFSPFDQTFHPLPLPKSPRSHTFVASSHGWMLLLPGHIYPTAETPSLFNPVTSDHILLPPLHAISSDDPQRYRYRGAISAPPADPHCAVLVIAHGKILLHRRLTDRNKWIRLDRPGLTSASVLNDVFHCAGKFYYVFEGSTFYVIDPFVAVPSMQLLRMDTSQLLPSAAPEGIMLQDLNGEIVALVHCYCLRTGVEDFRLFRADISRNRWDRVGSIGDQALFVDGNSALSLLSADVGCKSNCIYLPQVFLWFSTGSILCERWRMFVTFNLETRSFGSEQPIPDPATKRVLMQYDKYGLHWFTPSL